MNLVPAGFSLRIDQEQRETTVRGVETIRRDFKFGNGITARNSVVRHEETKLNVANAR